VLSKMLADRPIEDFKDYAAFLLIYKFIGTLSTEFEEPLIGLNEALIGSSYVPPREERALELLKKSLGHPVGKAYVDAFFPEESRTTTLDIIGRFLTAFRERIETRDWLSDETRAAALEKLDAFYYRVGYPDEWIDHSGVEIGSDPVANLININRFSNERQKAKYGGPVVTDQFNSSRSTLPIVVNASYNASINGFEVPAAMVQPPVFDPQMDAAVNFCRLGGVIAHEITHGFDSGGRQFDADGNLRDWWTPEDATAFEAEAQKLIDQANSTEVLPGLTANGPLNVKENMADVGGITMAYEALMKYLDEHPEENVEIDGLTPAQRCFVAWAQLWTSQATDVYIRNLVSGDNHPPNAYRAVAPLRHLDAFYDAFGIEEGDPMWLPPEKRVRAW
jgi:putative endopeptidase